MCMFSESVEVVHDTKIFARMDGNHQLLVYSMSVGASSDLAMILPIPTPAASEEKAVSFIDLSECPGFFDALSRHFVPAAATTALFGGELDLETPAPRLEVHQVGSFEASFVPRLAEFTRLDARFRLPDTVWSQLPSYADYGFAVFKLKPGRESRVHPMAFRFPSRDGKRLFFPTLHVHDGTVPTDADFDHELYFQGTPAGSQGWEQSFEPIQERHPEPIRMFPVSSRKTSSEDLFEELSSYVGEEAVTQNTDSTAEHNPPDGQETDDAPLVVTPEYLKALENGAYDPPPDFGFTSETTKGVVAFAEPAWKRSVFGQRKNEDIFVPLR